MMSGRILVTGATGQIGSELVPMLRFIAGPDKVVALGHHKRPSEGLMDSGPFVTADVTDIDALSKVVREQDVTEVYHLAALLSAVGEEEAAHGLGPEHARIAERSRSGQAAFAQGLLAQFHRRVRQGVSPGTDPAGDRPPAHHHVRRHQGGGRNCSAATIKAVSGSMSAASGTLGSSVPKRFPAAARRTMRWPSSTRRCAMAGTSASSELTRCCP